MRITHLVTLLVCTLTSTSCSFGPALTKSEVKMHYEAAQTFEAKHDYESASEQYWKALVDARSGGASPAVISALAYEFGRTTGYACHLAESEKFLLESLKMEENLPKRNSRNIGIRYFELARLMHDQQRCKESAEYYSKALREVEMNDGAKSDPATFEDIYREYADALNQIGDHQASQIAIQKAEQLQREYPGRKPEFIPVRFKCSMPLTSQSTGTR